MYLHNQKVMNYRGHYTSMVQKATTVIACSFLYEATAMSMFHFRMLIDHQLHDSRLLRSSLLTLNSSY